MGGRSVPCISLSVFVLSRCINCSFRFAFCYRCLPSFTNDGHPLYKERFLGIGLRGETFVVSSKVYCCIDFFPRFVCTFLSRYVCSFRSDYFRVDACLRAWLPSYLFACLLPCFLYSLLALLHACLLDYLAYFSARFDFCLLHFYI